MDKGADTTQRIVIGAAIVLGIIIVLTIGYSLYTKAKLAEGELANKVALDTATKKTSELTSVSLTNEAKNKNGFTYDGLIQKGKQESATTSNLEIVNESVDIEVPKEEYAEEPEPKEIVESEPVEPTEPKQISYIPSQTQNIDPGDRPLTADEILRIRKLPIENSPAGNLQMTLETSSGGEYKARY